MEAKENGEFTEPSPAGIFKVPGEPAIVINELPPLSSSETDLVVPCDVDDVHPQRFAGFGEWVEGREVRKLFGTNHFNGTVTLFDGETGWYRVVYEDGDFEDLEWEELSEILVPLDVNLPLKTLAMKIVKKRQKSVQKPGKSKVVGRNNGSFGEKGKGKENGGS
ncbi:Dirigent protein 17 [Striga hermonthica]|uniref:Dirigent protein 17 n=1 Tax=Striga hermonthica TaxID=68872 RepID=A0A9N7RPT3_STRHE|nr:Dirigent protein 17 [Striga hermonthica]